MWSGCTIIAVHSHADLSSVENSAISEVHHKPSSGITVYRNTGRLDAAGMPVLVLALRIPRPRCLSPGRYVYLRVVDWDGSGRPSLVIGAVHKQPFGRQEQIILMRNLGGNDGDFEFASTPLGIGGPSQANCKSMGIMAIVGVVACFVFSVITLPAILTLRGSR